MKDCKTPARDANPFGLRMEHEVRKHAKAKADELDRSLNWTINHLLKQALGLKEPT